MKIKRIVITVFLIIGISFVFIPDVNAGTYQCNPYDCRCQDVTRNPPCGLELVCWCVGSYTGGECCSYNQLCLQQYMPSECCVGWKLCEWQTKTCEVCDTCYRTCCDELNTSPSQPTEILLTSDEGTSTLSLDSGSPTVVNLSNATVTMPELTQPGTSSGVGYQYRFYDESDTLLDTIEDTNRTQSIPAGVISTMNAGGIFKVSGLYYTVNECDSNKKYSTALETYLTTNNAPEPICVGAGCDDPYAFIQDLGSDITTKGCESTTYTGQEINNPLHLNMSVTDSDGVDEREGLIIWMSKDTNVLSSSTISTNPQESGIDDAAILIRKNANWSNTPLLYSLNTDNTWTQITSLVEDTNGTNILRIFDITTTQTTDVEFDFKIEYLGSDSGLSGMYNFYAQGLDDTLLSGNNITHDELVNIFDFGIDLVDPTIDSVSKTPVDQENITISWDSEDTISGVMTSILNGYISPASGATSIELNSLQISNPVEPAEEEDRGLFGDVGTTALRLDSDESANLDIGNNDAGSIYVSITTYDNACNYTNDEEDVSLSPWLSTQGGTFYSKEAVASDPVDVSAVTELLNKFQRFDRTTISQGTELLGSRLRYTYQLIHPELDMVSASSIYDSNNQKTYWFNHIYDMIEASNNLTDPNNACTETFCTYKSESDIVFDSTFTCSSSTIYLSEGDITISPQVVGTAAQNNDTGCIYIAKGDIHITNTGHSASANSIEYDYLEGFFVAEDQIIIEAGTTADDRKYGLEVEGSLIALGKDNVGVQAIVNNRTLKALNSIAPSLLVNYHPKYSKLTQDLVGEEALIFIQEVGGSKN